MHHAIRIGAGTEELAQDTRRYGRPLVHSIYAVGVNPFQIQIVACPIGAHAFGKKTSKLANFIFLKIDWSKLNSLT
jgi:hypothetical protein